MPLDERETEPISSPMPPGLSPPATEPTNQQGGPVRSFLSSYWTPAGKLALRNLIGLVLCTAISQASVLTILLMLTNGLSQTGFAAVIFSLNVQVFLVMIGTVGLGPIVVRDLTQHPEGADYTRTAFLLIVGVAGALTGLVLAMVAALLPLSWDERVMLWYIAAGNIAVCLNMNPLFDAAHRQSLAAALMLPGDFLAVGLIGWLYWTAELSVPGVAVAFLMRWLMSAVLHIAVYHQSVQPFRRVWDARRIRAMLRSGRPMMLAGIIAAIPMSGSVVVVRLLAGEAQTAIYGLAFQIIAAEVLAVTLLFRVLQPHISGRYGLTPRFLRQLTAVLVTAMCLLVCGALLGGWLLIHYLLPEYYRPAFGVLAVLQGYVVCLTAALAVKQYLLRFHRERWIQVQHLLATAVYLVLAVLVGHRFHVGFAVCTVAAAAVALVVGLFGLTNPPRDQPAVGMNT